MALCVPITKYRNIKKLRDEAVGKVEEVTKQVEELQDYKNKYEELQKQADPRASLGGGDEADSGGKLVLEEEPYKEEADKVEPWSEELKVKDLAKMAIVYLHEGVIPRDPKGSRASLKGTLSVKPLQITIVNLSKKTFLEFGGSFFKSGRFSVQPSGPIHAGHSHTFAISSKDGRAKTGVKGGLAFVVFDKEEEVVEEEEKHDEENGEKKKKKKKEKKEKKEKKRKEKKSKKEKKKAKEEEGEGEQENKEAEEEGKDGENEQEEEKENDETIPEENAAGDGLEETAEENKEENTEENKGEEEEEEEQKEEEAEESREGNGDFFVCAFENPLAGNAKAKCNKTESTDIMPVVKQLKNDKPSSQELFGHYKDGKRHFVFIWKDDDLEW